MLLKIKKNTKAYSYGLDSLACAFMNIYKLIYYVNVLCGSSTLLDHSRF